jgi:hypothetical protein
MLKAKYLFIPALFSGFAAAAQPTSEELIDWNVSRRLTWDDYKASPNPNNDAAASTTTYLRISYNISSEGFTYKIRSQFSRTSSWGRYKTDYVLKHEQGHFDIAEIFARKLNRQMHDYVFNRRSYQKDLNRIYFGIENEREQMQNDYDLETNHSINQEKQALWFKKIDSLLREYDDWKNY